MSDETIREADEQHRILERITPNFLNVRTIVQPDANNLSEFQIGGSQVNQTARSR